MTLTPTWIMKVITFFQSLPEGIQIGICILAIFAVFAVVYWFVGPELQDFEDEEFRL